MTTIINAVSGTGLTQTADASGVIKVQSNGSTVTAQAWFYGGFVGGGSAYTTTNSYNVSSFTQPSQGVVTINFTNAMSNANYAAVGMCNYGGPKEGTIVNVYAQSTTSMSLSIGYTTGTSQVTYYNYGIGIAVFGT